jgi:hypothetical protein
MGHFAPLMFLEFLTFIYSLVWGGFIRSLISSRITSPISLTINDDFTEHGILKRPYIPSPIFQKLFQSALHGKYISFSKK